MTLTKMYRSRYFSVLPKIISISMTTVISERTGYSIHWLNGVWHLWITEKKKII